MNSHPYIRRIAASAMALALVFGTAACGDDDDTSVDDNVEEGVNDVEEGVEDGADEVDDQIDEGAEEEGEPEDEG